MYTMQMEKFFKLQDNLSKIGLKNKISVSLVLAQSKCELKLDWAQCKKSSLEV